MFKKHVFSIGGLGNNYFQAIKAESENALISDFLNRALFCRIMGWTFHGNLSRHYFDVKFSKFYLLNFFTLALDLLIFKLFKVSFFSVFDLRSFKSPTPLIYAFNFLGYFQTHAIKKQTSILKKSLLIEEKTSLPLAIHFRGGDFANSARLDEAYYSDAIKLFFPSEKDFLLLTNDPSFAIKILSNLELSCKFSDGSIKGDLNSLYFANKVILSNSTFSLMAAIESISLKDLVIIPSVMREKFNEDYLTKQQNIKFC